jgi:hypothetical protein
MKASADAEQVMTTVFIGGSRRVSRLSSDVRARINRMMEQHLSIVVGDANGAFAWSDHSNYLNRF